MCTLHSQGKVKWQAGRQGGVGRALKTALKVSPFTAGNYFCQLESSDLPACLPCRPSRYRRRICRRGAPPWVCVNAADACLQVAKRRSVSHFHPRRAARAAPARAIRSQSLERRWNTDAPARLQHRQGSSCLPGRTRSTAAAGFPFQCEREKKSRTTIHFSSVDAAGASHSKRE